MLDPTNGIVSISDTYWVTCWETGLI